MKQFKERVDSLLDLANRTNATTTHGSMGSGYVNNELFHELRASSLSFIKTVYGEDHPYYKDFDRLVIRNNPSDTQEGRGILKSIKTEIDNGWLLTYKGLVTAEIFSDFLEMSEHLLEEKYRDPAAVVIGSTLEEHLRQLAIKHGIPIEETKTGKSIPKKADLLNSELSAASAYNKLDLKSVTSWLELRNKAAHGKYAEYTIDQVNLMLQGVRDFISRNKI